MSQHEMTLRDQDTVDVLSRRLRSARRIVIVGNGGIALELVHALKGIQVREQRSLDPCTTCLCGLFLFAGALPQVLSYKVYASADCLGGATWTHRLCIL
jgi:hypothetical protein